ncbi:CTP synthase [Candidatus Gottesmanbacteria bacterium RIFCSPLOWO2_01_FULL_43_11b]|uniref:CTP synthase (glutamine hydrolyzing) n=1 Tax=Candidatus Gottesmanbacteria bacterium RIFCSPLOWO2_01_FULL_43_11b TaxID=1798392 RepID=A0A1F6AIV5_9BACT|nr:MAG: CTP synthase [Candidatus Gottesmanbacteria bacterium RIFCSPLOWO2_01_FULL_43_11b]
MPTKYIFISGGVLSGLGKGVTAASIGFLLEARGFRVTTVKCENYLNIDAGLINPIEHGDPFLCEDGTEADMDMGSYEKFMDKNVLRHNFVTMGQIYQAVITRERSFAYKGEDVETIPHVTDEIIKRINEAARKDKAEIVVIELGGTAGEYQNILYYEASRVLKIVKKAPVVHVHVSYLPTPRHLGEPKTKPTQLSVKFLQSMGIQPDFIVCRGEKAIDKRRRERLAMFCNVDPDQVINNPDMDTPYAVPIVLEGQQFAQKILKILGESDRKPKLEGWKKFLTRVETSKKKTIEIAIVGKYFATGDYELRDSYAALLDALDHAGWQKGVTIKTRWVNSERIEKGEPAENLLGGVDGVIVPIGWGPRGVEGMITAIKYAREHKIPYLGLCYGMQLAVVEFARNVLGFSDANTTECDPDSKHPVIHIIPSQKEKMARRAYGGTMRLGRWECRVKSGSIADSAYIASGAYDDTQKKIVGERHRHRYEVNDDYTKQFEAKGMQFTGRSVVEDLAEIVELPQSMHPFFLGTQFHPEYRSRPLSPHPLFLAYIAACLV